MTGNATCPLIGVGRMGAEISLTTLFGTSVYGPLIRAKVTQNGLLDLIYLKIMASAYNIVRNIDNISS